MGTLALTLAWLLLGQAPIQQVYHTNQRDLSVPIGVPDAFRSELRDLLLFASYDQGKTYQQVAKVGPDAKEFLFRATNDGVCWLKVAVINRQGKQEPENVQQGPPDQRILIDTMKPVVKTFAAQRQGEDITLTWDILEDHFDPQAFRLEYQVKDNSASFWIPVQATANLSGQQRFRPNHFGPLLFRLIAKDQAGNQSVAGAEVAGGVTAASYSPPAGPASGSSNLAPTPNLVPTPIPPPMAPPSTLGADTLPPAPPADAVKQPQPQQQPPNAWAPTNNPLVEPKERVVATSQAPAVPTPPPVPAPAPASPPPTAEPRKPLPPVQHVNHPEVLLDYKLSKVGKSGIGSVDLWWTRNDGQSWDLYASDTKIRGTTQNGPQQATVELPGEGTYGFVLVVKSQAGLGKAPPRAGDSPEIRVEVDTTPPDAQLFAPRPDPARPGNLILKWIAKDSNLTNNPVTLEWAEKREGPWQNIVRDYHNTGMFSWGLPDQLPVQVYMRLRVRDLAGNESIAVTPEPQLVDLSEPEGTLLNVSVAPRK
jgi:hypothetical protein